MMIANSIDDDDQRVVETRELKFVVFEDTEIYLYWITVCTYCKSINKK